MVVLNPCFQMKPVFEISRNSIIKSNSNHISYSAPLYVDITKTTITTTKEGDEATDDVKTLNKVFIGKVPIMLRSSYCMLPQGSSDKDLTDLGECPYDQGGYFIINGGEKVLIAQEKMSLNHVYVFKKAMPSKFSYVAEIRSTMEVGSRPTSTMLVKMLAPGSKVTPMGTTVTNK